MDDIEAIFSNLLGEIDDITQVICHLTMYMSELTNPMEAELPTKKKEDKVTDIDQSLEPKNQTSEMKPDSQKCNFSMGFSDESPNELEDSDVVALMADLDSELPGDGPPSDEETCLPDKPNASFTILYLPPSDSDNSSTVLHMTKADEIKLPLEKKETTVKKLVVKVVMDDGSSKTLQVADRQTVREVIDTLFEKTYCDRSVDWSLCETSPELQAERGFEDHEHLVESLSAWTCSSKNLIYFVSRPEKYALFKEPQLFYMWKQTPAFLSKINKRTKGLLLKENFEGPSVIVPDIEGTLYLKEYKKKSWKQGFFLLRASGIYYVPKGKTKSSSDLVCFVHFEKVHVYTTTDYKQKYRAPTDFCFILKHPCIEKECQNIKFLCCDNERTLSLWVNAIRVAKYGTILYKNYLSAAMREPGPSSKIHG